MTTSFIWHDLKQLMIIDYRINQLQLKKMVEQHEVQDTNDKEKRKAKKNLWVAIQTRRIEDVRKII